MKIYTRRGDGGDTGLFGGTTVAKDDPRVEAYGTVDELNAGIGVVVALLSADEGHRDDVEALWAVQSDLFAIGARLAAADPASELERDRIPVLEDDRIPALERWIDALDEELEPLDSFVLPGGSPAGAHLHVARTLCRRAERRVVSLLALQPDLSEVVLPYLNRLSDLLFTLARAVNVRAGRPERGWTPVRRRVDGAPEAGPP